MSNWKDLGTLLLEYGLISASDLKEGLELHQTSGMRIGEALVRLGKISMEDVDWILSKQLNIPFVIVEDVTPNIDLLTKFQKEFLISNRILPLYETDDEIAIAIEDPFNKKAIEHIKETIAKEVNISTGSGRRIKETLQRTLTKAGLPELIESVRNINEKIRDTSFYRIDFILSEHSCTVNVYGCGILKHVLTIDASIGKEEIFRAFDSLNIPFLFDHLIDDRRSFLAIYPLTNKLDMTGLPAIVGCYGLYFPDGTVFTDAGVHGLSGFYCHNNPVQGYPFLATKRLSQVYDHIIYTVDSAPAEFNNFYVNMHTPLKCRDCNGTGCHTCNDLGYQFKKTEGTFSSDELKEKLKELTYGED